MTYKEAVEKLNELGLHAVEENREGKLAFSDTFGNFTVYFDRNKEVIDLIYKIKNQEDIHKVKEVSRIFEELMKTPKKHRVDLPKYYLKLKGFDKYIKVSLKSSNRYNEGEIILSRGLSAPNTTNNRIKESFTSVEIDELLLTELIDYFQYGLIELIAVQEHENN